MSVPQTMTSLRQVAEWIGADLHGADAHFDQVSTDTRTLAPGALFVALVGERFDGHGHLQAALDAGAVGALVANHQPDVSIPQLVVGDSLVGLRGSYIPFAVGSTERKESGDPRPSLRTRYGNLERYLSTLQLACDQLHADGYLLGEDVERTMRIQRQRVAPLFESPMP